MPSRTRHGISRALLTTERRKRTQPLAAQEDILLQFYLDSERFALTHDPSWDPYPLRGQYGASRPRTEKLHTAALEWDDTLWMPTRFRLHETELFVCPGRAHPRIEALDGPGPSLLPEGHDPCPRAWVPVITLAVIGWKALRAAAEQGESRMMLAEAGYLVFRVHGGEVEVQSWKSHPPINPEQSSRRPRQATVRFADLMTAWEVFSEEVRTQFLEVLPELAENEEFGTWFREGLPYLRRQPI
jgi:hypothetical protein